MVDVVEQHRVVGARREPRQHAVGRHQIGALAHLVAAWNENLDGTFELRSPSAVLRCDEPIVHLVFDRSYGEHHGRFDSERRAKIGRQGPRHLQAGDERRGRLKVEVEAQRLQAAAGLQPKGRLPHEATSRYVRHAQLGDRYHLSRRRLDVNRPAVDTVFEPARGSER
jgi:hypothetical protein